MNKVILIGNVGSDPELKTIPSGAKVAEISLATKKTWKDKEGQWQEQTEWHKIVGWHYTADLIMRLKKGDTVSIEGSIKYSSYEKENTKIYVTKILAEKIQRIVKRETGSSRQTETTSNPDGNLPF